MSDIRNLKDMKVDKKSSRVLILSLILAFIIIIFIKKPLKQKIVEIDNQKAEIISESIPESNASGGEGRGMEDSEGINFKNKPNVISSGEDDLVAINKALGSVDGIKYVEKEISDEEDSILICIESKREDIQKAVDKFKELRLDKKIRSIDIVGMEDSKYKVILLFDL